MSIETDLIGKSIKFPLQLKGGRVAMQPSNTQQEFEELINQRYAHILETQVGERVPRRNWGSYSKTLIFKTSTDPEFEAKLKYFVKSALDIHEKKTVVTFITINKNKDRLNKGIVDVEVEYMELSSNTPGKFSYPFNTKRPSINLNIES